MATVFYILYTIRVKKTLKEEATNKLKNLSDGISLTFDIISMCDHDVAKLFNSTSSDTINHFAKLRRIVTAINTRINTVKGTLEIDDIDCAHEANQLLDEPLLITWNCMDTTVDNYDKGQLEIKSDEIIPLVKKLEKDFYEKLRKESTDTNFIHALKFLENDKNFGYKI